MEWRHNLVTDTARVPLIGTALTEAGEDTFSLWMADPMTLKVRRMDFNAQGVLGRPYPEPEAPFDALLQNHAGYVLARYKNGTANVSGHAPDHRVLWKTSLKDADSPRWSLATGSDGRLYLSFSSCNPYDAYRQAHVVIVAPGYDEAVQPFFTGPEDEYPFAQLLITQPERLVFFVRSYGAGIVFYVLNHKAEPARGGAFSVHPHSRWAVPLCHVSLENGDILMGGYKEEVAGRRRAWVCRFDAEISAMNGKVVAGDAAEQAVTAFASQPDGSVLALCPPWKVLRLSSKGLLTHVWEVPTSLRRNAISAILSAPGGGCFITGRSFTVDNAEIAPAVWLGKIALNEFVEL